MARRGWWVARAMAAAVTVVVAVGCGAAEKSGPSAMPSRGTGTVEVGGRPVVVHIPDTYDAGRAAPLVVALHGYSSNAEELESYLRLTPESDRRGFVYVYPQGETDSRGEQFWNATDACCAFSSSPDDSKYLSELISTIQEAYLIDRARVYLIGHSNGGFMSFRMACDHADQIAAIVSLNGASWEDAGRCRPSEPVSVLAIHSSTDETIAFGGGYIAGDGYPSADTTLAQWRGYDRCAEAGRDAPPLDLDTGLPGAETTVRSYEQGCAGGSVVQAWTITGGSHVPSLTAAFAPAVTDFLLGRSKAAR